MFRAWDAPSLSRSAPEENARDNSAFPRVFHALCVRSSREHGAEQEPAQEVSLLRRFLPGVAVALGLGLELQVLEFLAVAGAVAEDLVLACEILRRAVDRG